METENKDQEKDIEFRNLWVDEVEYRTSLTRKYLNRKPYEPPSLKKVKAFIPGTIREIFVKKRSKVKLHDDLLVLEAMKMRNVLKAPADGVIKAVHVKTGQAVPKEFLLIEFE
jgi:biotin carboxyl carrier protein